MRTRSQERLGRAFWRKTHGRRETAAGAPGKIFGKRGWHKNLLFMQTNLLLIYEKICTVDISRTANLSHLVNIVCERALEYLFNL